MILNHLQERIESQYDLVIPYDVSTFVSHDAAVARTLTEACDNEHSSDQEIDIEVVFVRQNDDTMEFTLYLDQKLVQAFDAAFAPMTDEANETNINEAGVVEARTHPTVDELCTVVEGVSHAVCLLWHAHNDRQVRPVDLELQAEIDKFTLMLNESQHRLHHRELLQQLFTRFQFKPLQESSLRERYRIANDLAARYCHWLADTFIDSANHSGLESELARFYRLSGNAKFERIKRLH